MPFVANLRELVIHLGFASFSNMHPRRKAVFLLLGSASLDLVWGAAETLAGRIQFVDVDGLSLSEVGNASHLCQISKPPPNSLRSLLDQSTHRQTPDKAPRRRLRCPQTVRDPAKSHRRSLAGARRRNQDTRPRFIH